ncbi:TSCPD domain-containing protein [Desulforhopalus singaporensis]|uniref:ribonucleoside-diphosphate reductase n=1 Tax=Desulforhopalus singaporensis TaxID=91360 RepID=A0A1H0RVT6_9BACT|nr:hypothetical protein [Desulforhopalus singaporensis]SDP33523.1 hypothetical protein SAMN05660330_02445 [Desulforhopalus singaporensis]
MAQKACRFCGSTEKITKVKKRFSACEKCRPAVYAVLNTPDVVEQVWPLLQDRAILPQVRRIKIPWRTEIAEELEAKRFRTFDRESNKWYLVVSVFNEKPVELFVTSPRENDHRLQSSLANLTALTRLVSLMLRHLFIGEQITLEKIVTQLGRSSRQKNDLPDLVKNVLHDNYLEDEKTS